MAADAAIRALLDSGRVRKWSPSVPATGADVPPAWGLETLCGRLVELVGEGETALTTVAIDLARAAQASGEPVVWLTEGHAVFFPPDAAACGIDLAALPIVRLPDVPALLVAADRVLRAGAFGLVVVDFAEGAAIPLGVQSRLGGLAQQHEAALVCLVREGASVLGSFASLRAECRRRRVSGAFEWSVRVVKDKRYGRGWEHARGCDGAVGLR